MRINTVLIASLAMVSGFALAKPAKKGKKKKEAPAAAPAAEEPAAAEEKSESLSAKESAPTSSYKPAYGLAGCGLGSTFIKGDGFVQVFAATFNGSFYSQLFGITSGSSNCRSGSAETAQIEQRVFVEANLVSLNREAASGQGETLNAFADLLGCDAAKSSEVSKSNFGTIYSSAEPTAILSGYKAVLADQCSRLI